MGPGAVLAAMEVLRRAGYLVRVAPAPALPEPEMVLLMYREKLTLETIRERPGIMLPELAEAMGLRRQNTDTYVRLLTKGGHVLAERMPMESHRRLYPAHDRPLGNVSPHEKVRWKR